ncbi:hypothetical protein FACS1894191_3180 [Clostridia bacterium]|nr:hypothetical protein FACS1894191_3180 [Clostridia bacterium]
MINCADNAIMAKVRALYGNRLTEADYTRLLSAKSVSEIAAYLKNDTAYGPILAEIREDLVHRGQLETMIRRRGLDIYMSLVKYSYNDDLFLTIYMMENEIRQLLLAMRFLNAGSMDRYIVALPVYLSRYMSFDLFALARVKSYDELMAVARHSRYYPIIGRFRPATSDRPVNITACEKALMEYYYTALLETVEKRYGGSTKTDLTNLLRGQVAFHNLSVAYRLKKYFGYAPQRIREAMLDVKTDFKAVAFDSIINADADADLSGLVKELRVIRRYLPDWDSAVREISVNLNRAQRNMSRKSYRFSTKPMVVVVNFMLLLEIEVKNIVNIIEGVRYGVPAEEIRSLIVI